MSKMPAKKKSCFQITSVTQAQAAANSITDETESIDDPDECRTEDSSSLIFDVSQTDVCVCGNNSSEAAVNHVGEHQEGTAPVNGGLCYKSIGTGGRNTPLSIGGSVPTATPASQSSSVSSSGAPTSCSSRFRVIKLDHGTGEPFRRGRWTCTEFYEKDLDSNRTVDSVKPTVTNDHSIDGDRGLGATSNCVAASNAFSIQTVENSDNGYSKGNLTPLFSSEPLQQGYSLTPQIGSVASAFQPTKYATITSQQAQISVPPVALQTFIPNQNGVHRVAMSPVMSCDTHRQQLALLSTSSSQSDYCPQHFGSSTQGFPATSLSIVPSSSLGASPLITPAGPGGPGLLPQRAEAALAPGLHLQAVSALDMTPISQTQIMGAMGISAASPVTINSHIVQSVPVTVPNVTSGWTLAAGGLVSSNFNNHSEDTRPKSDVLPQSVSSVGPGKDTVKPLITEGVSLPSPTVSFFGISIPVDGDEDSASGVSVVAIDNKIEQAMDLVKSHLMYAVREEVEVLKEQIKELYERNSVLERENAVLKSLANSEQLNQLCSQLSQVNSTPLPQIQHQHSVSTSPNNGNALVHYDAVKSVPNQPNFTSA